MYFGMKEKLKFVEMISVGNGFIRSERPMNIRGSF